MQENFTKDQLKAKHEAEMLRRIAENYKGITRGFSFVREYYLLSQAEKKEKEAETIAKLDEIN